MGRRVAIIAVLLLGGAVVNVAVAWGRAYCHALDLTFSNRGPRSTLHGDDAQQLLRQHMRVAEPGEYSYTATTFADLGWRLQLLEAHPRLSYYSRFITSVGGEPGLHSAAVIRAGLPALSFQGECRIRPAPITFHLAWPVRRSPVAEWGFVPLRPLLPGFAANTLFYAALLWLLMYGALALRRLIRLRRGLCVKCAYPMGESGTCTECGGALPARAAT